MNKTTKKNCHQANGIIAGQKKPNPYQNVECLFISLHITNPQPYAT